MADPPTKHVQGKIGLIHVGRSASEAIDFTAKPVVVKVGLPASSFHVEERLLCSGSEFFQAQMKKDWKMDQLRVVELPDQSVADFNIYLNWLYRRQVFIDITEGETRKTSRVTSRFAAAYALGDFLIDIDFKDALTDMFVVNFSTKFEDTCWVPNSGDRKELYERTSIGSKARSVLVHRMARSLNAKLLSDEDPSAFLLDLARENCTKDSESTVTATARCAFHEHAPGEQNCYRKKHALNAWKRYV